MPNSKQAMKRLKQDDLKRQRNRGTASRMKTEIKRVLEAVENNDAAAAEAALPEAYKRIDKAAKNRVIHPNSANHKKSRLARAIKRSKSDG